MSLRAAADAVANKKAGGATERFAPAFAPLGACKRTDQRSRPAPVPDWNLQIAEVVEVVVIEKA